MLRNKHKTMLALGLLLTCMTASADYKSDIIKSCNDYQKGVSNKVLNACKLYIDGFIDAAIVTKSAVVNDLSTKKEPSGFVQRAYQTRVSNRMLSSFEDVNYQFCLSIKADRKVVASKIAKAIKIVELTHKPLKQILFETLVVQFPCEQPNF